MKVDVKTAYSLLRRGDGAGAERICRSVLAHDSKNANALLILGMVEAARGSLVGAASNFEKAAALEPSRADVHFNLGLLRLRQGQVDAAITSFSRAVTIDPSNFDAALQLAESLSQAARFDEAVGAFDVAIRSNRRNPAAWTRRGYALYSCGKFDQAVDSYKTAIGLEPRSVDALNGAALALTAMSKFTDAVALLSDAVLIDPTFGAAYSNRAVAYTKLQEFSLAEIDHKRAMAIDAADPRVKANYAEFLHRLGRNSEAVVLLRQLESVDPIGSSVLLGNVMADELKNSEALKYFDRALSLNPSEPFAHWCRALVNLRLGNLKDGFQEFEWRSKGAVSTSDQARGRREWQPTEHAIGQQLYLFAEQGLGDSIQFARYVPQLVERGYDVILEVQRPLAKIFKSLHPRVTVVEGCSLRETSDNLCALPSLPAKLGTTVETIPAPIPYLHPVGLISEGVAARLARSKQIRIGICWSGNALHERDVRRSIPLSVLAPILTLPDASFISLQKDLRPSDESDFYRSSLIDFRDLLFDFDDTASLIMSLDVVISVDTSVAHLAGALGKPVWILLPYVPDWRWMLNRNDSPWYPTARLFRQDRHADWPGVIQAVRESLLARIDAISASK